MIAPFPLSPLNTVRNKTMNYCQLQRFLQKIPKLLQTRETGTDQLHFNKAKNPNLCLDYFSAR